MPRKTSADHPHHARTWFLVAITVILAGWALRATATFLVPMVFAIFLALVVAPLDGKVGQAVPRRFGWLGHVAAMGTILVALLLALGLIWFAAQQVVERLPFTGADSLLPQLEAGLFETESPSPTDAASPDDRGGGEGAARAAAADLAQDRDTQGNPASGRLPGGLEDIFSGAGGLLMSKVGGWATGLATQVLSATGAMLAAMVLVFFLTLLMLIEGPTWREKVASLMGRSSRRETMDALDVIARRLRRYLLARTVLGMITAALYVAWIWLFGIDLLLVWGLIVFLLSYIPTLGSLIAGLLPVAYAFVQKDPGTALAVGAGILVIEQVMGNYVDPQVQGRQVSLSPLVVLIALLVWSWIWGIAGAILAVPITMSAMVVLANVPPLRPFALILSNATDMEELDRQASASGPQ